MKASTKRGIRRDVMREENHHALEFFLLNPNIKKAPLTLHHSGYRSDGSSLMDSRTTHSFAHVVHYSEHDDKNASSVYLYTQSTHSRGRSGVASEPSLSSMVWETTAEKLHRSVRYNVAHFDAMTCKAIGALGRYLNIVGERLDNGYASNTYNEKSTLVHLAMDRIEAMQPLENIKRADNLGLEGEALYLHVHNMFNESIEILVAIKKGLVDKLKKTALKTYDKTIFDDLREDIQKDIDALGKKLRSFEDQYDEMLLGSKDFRFLEPLISATGPDSMMQFVKTGIKKAVRNTQRYNQNMTYAKSHFGLGGKDQSSWFPGKLNSACEDAIQVVDNFTVDPHNPITPKHQGRYGEANDCVVYKIDDLDGSRRARQVAMGIDIIEGEVSYQKNASPKTGSLMVGVKRKAIRVTHNTKAFVAGDTSSLWTPLKGFLTLGVGSIFEVVDLVVGAGFGLFRARVPWSAAHGFRMWLERFGQKKQIDSDLRQALDAFSKPGRMVSWGGRVGSLLGNSARDGLFGALQAVKEILQDLFFKVWRDLYHDIRVLFPSAKVQEAPNRLEEALDRLREERHQIAEELMKQGLISAPVRTEKRFAQADYSLDPGEWNDVLNVLVKGGSAALEEVTHNVHAKNPVLGLFLNAVCAGGALAIVAPEVFAKMMSSVFGQAMTTVYTEFARSVGSEIAYGTASIAMAGSFLRSKDAFIIKDLIESHHGHHEAVMPEFIEVLTKSYRESKKIPDEAVLDEAQRDEIQQIANKMHEFENTVKAAKVMSLVQKDRALLPHLSEKNKRDYLAYLQDRFHNQPDLIDTVYEAMYPVKNGSIIKTAIMIPARYVTMFPRALFAGISYVLRYGYAKGSVQKPRRNIILHQLEKKTVKDIARVGHACAKLAQTIGKLFRQVVIAPLYDMLVNSIGARIQGALFKRHGLAKKSYHATQAADKAFEHSRAVLAKPLDSIRKKASKPNATVVANRARKRATRDDVLESSSSRIASSLSHRRLSISRVKKTKRDSENESVRSLFSGEDTKESRRLSLSSSSSEESERSVSSDAFEDRTKSMSLPSLSRRRRSSLDSNSSQSSVDSEPRSRSGSMEFKVEHGKRLGDEPTHFGLTRRKIKKWCDNEENLKKYKIDVVKVNDDNVEIVFEDKSALNIKPTNNLATLKNGSSEDQIKNAARVFIEMSLFAKFGKNLDELTPHEKEQVTITPTISKKNMKNHKKWIKAVVEEYGVTFGEVKSKAKNLDVRAESEESGDDIQQKMSSL